VRLLHPDGQRDEKLKAITERQMRRPNRIDPGDSHGPSAAPRVRRRLAGVARCRGSAGGCGASGRRAQAGSNVPVEISDAIKLGARGGARSPMGAGGGAVLVLGANWSDLRGHCRRLVRSEV